MPAGLIVLDIDTDIINPLNGTMVDVNGVNIGKNGIGTIQLTGTTTQSSALNAIIIGSNTGIASLPNGNDACVLIGHSAGKLTTSGGNNIMIGPIVSFDPLEAAVLTIYQSEVAQSIGPPWIEAAEERAVSNTSLA